MVSEQETVSDLSCLLQNITCLACNSMHSYVRGRLLALGSSTHQFLSLRDHLFNEPEALLWLLFPLWFSWLSCKPQPFFCLPPLSFEVTGMYKPISGLFYELRSLWTGVFMSVQQVLIPCFFSLSLPPKAQDNFVISLFVPVLSKVAFACLHTFTLWTWCYSESITLWMCWGNSKHRGERWLVPGCGAVCLYPSHRTCAPTGSKHSLSSGVC